MLKSGVKITLNFARIFAGPFSSSTSASVSMFRQENNYRAPGSKFHGSVTNGYTFPIFKKYGKNPPPPREYMVGSGGFFLVC